VHDVGGVDQRGDEPAGHGGRGQLGPYRLEVEVVPAEERPGGSQHSPWPARSGHPHEAGLDRAVLHQCFLEVAMQRAMAADVLAHEQRSHPSIVRKSGAHGP
jgi:hypothetical protein